MNIFEFDNYKKFVHKKLSESSKRGHGQYSRIAEYLNIHTSMVSQIFNGDKDLSFEQACAICDYFGFTELEVDYFISLVQFNRAGTQRAKEKCRRDIARIKLQADSLKNRIKTDRNLTEEDNAFFYSYWFYTATKLVTAIPGCHTREVIAKKLGLSLSTVNKTLEFLLSIGLCIESDGKIKPGLANTHLGADSPLIGVHHQNWRVKGLERMGQVLPSELFLTLPATLTEKDVLKLRMMIVEFIEKFIGVIDTSKSEVLYCLNIDWFNVCP